MLSKDYIQIYTTETEELADTETYRRLYDCLPDFRRKHIDGMKNAEARKLSAAAFWLLLCGLHNIKTSPYPENCTSAENDLLTCRWDIRDPEDNTRVLRDILGYETGRFGKPFMSKLPDIHFSLSHTPGMAMCVISGSEVGCDTERIKPASPESVLKCRHIAERFFHSGEREFLNAFDNDGDFIREFFRLWTMKESYIKYTGRGLGQGLDGFSVLSGMADAVDPLPAAHISGEYSFSVCSGACGGRELPYLKLNNY